jgi:superfamily II DNA or RNA helicase
MRVNLYDDQAEFVQLLRGSIQRGKKSILGVAAPAFGKTVVAAYITEQARHKNAAASVWFVVHRKNLLRQTSKSFWSAHIEHGLITSGKMRSNLPIQIATIGTLYSRYSSLAPPSIMFIDEAHLARGSRFETVIEWAKENGVLVIGLTGTPDRLDGKGLGALFDDLIEAKSVRWLIDQGRLSDYIAYTVPNTPNLSAVKKHGDYNTQELAEVMDKPRIVGDAIAHWKKYALGLRTVCYCVNVEHSIHTCQAFNAAGISAVHVDADTTEAELKDACEGLADGRYLVLCNCELVIEGFDLSSQVGREVPIEACILLRPTMSLARYLQMVFRALRKKPRPAIILDHAGCFMRHGLPCEDREWSLGGRKKTQKREDEQAFTVQQCRECYHVFKKGPEKCPQCGHPVPVQHRELEEVDGDLVQVDIEAARRERKREQGQSRTLQELVNLGIRRQMRKPAEWAAITIAARAGRKPTREEFQEAKNIFIQVKNEQRDSTTTRDYGDAF